ncbi:hypothetical protein B0H13DRAFT_589036 [Mycena leptocephala]|nr:hypothetical protein B0H13DRAFT_589036 [Mycena leptocephala]
MILSRAPLRLIFSSAMLVYAMNQHCIGSFVPRDNHPRIFGPEVVAVVPGECSPSAHPLLAASSLLLQNRMSTKILEIYLELWFTVLREVLPRDARHFASKSHRGYHHSNIQNLDAAFSAEDSAPKIMQFLAVSFPQVCWSSHLHMERLPSTQSWLSYRPQNPTGVRQFLLS